MVHSECILIYISTTENLLSIAMKQHVWAIESYNYSNGTVKAARAICPGNPDTARWNQQADEARYTVYTVQTNW